MSTKNSIPEFSEIYDFHPIVEQWLLDNQIPYQHEKKISDGRIDFYALINGEKTLIECKTEYIKTRDIVQIAAYCFDNEGHKGILAIPEYEWTGRLERICRHFDITLMPFRVDPKIASMSVVRRQFANTCRGNRPYLSELFNLSWEGVFPQSYGYKIDKFRSFTLQYFNLLCLYHDASHSITTLAHIISEFHDDKNQCSDYDAKWLELDWFEIIHVWVIRQMMDQLKEGEAG